MKLLLYYYSLAILSLLVFLHSFFPLQQYDQIDLIQPPMVIKDFKLNVTELYEQHVDRIILIVIDALREDFIHKDNMPFITSIYTQKGCIMSVEVKSPTVTLPRIKALTTGDVPQFIDLILNLGTTEAIRDSFLHRVTSAGKKIVFYGDDTWLKLYPKIFSRFEAVSSFFVNDFTEVDNNVTRNVNLEINNSDWDVMILHYLGLDHIGHVYGPTSPLVPLKLQELDEIIKKIYLETVGWNKRTLIAVTGDHGMKDGGGHGGSTYSETHVPFVAVGVSCKNDKIAQIDMPSTLAVLMGLPLPSTSIGKVILNMFHHVSVDKVLYILYYNSLHLQSRISEFQNIFMEALDYHYYYLKSNNLTTALKAQEMYHRYSRKVRDKLIESSVKQHVPILLVSCLFLTLSTVVMVCEYLKIRRNRWLNVFCPFVLFSLMFLSNVELLLVVLSILIVTILLYYLFRIIKVIWKAEHNMNSLIFGCIAVHLLSICSSSFIEEEHQTWYFFYSSFLLFYLYWMKEKSYEISYLLVGLRVLRTLNQTGDKWAHLPDLSQWLLLEEHYIFLHIVFCIGLIGIYFCCTQYQSDIKDRIVLGIILANIYYFHMWTNQSPFVGRLIWIFIFTNLLVVVVKSNQYFNYVIMSWMLCVATLMRTYNVILIPSCIYASRVMSKTIKQSTILIIAHVWLGRVFFFLQGHSNSLASIDVATGYVGLQEYVPFLVFLQVWCHTYSFPILTNLLLLKQFYPYDYKVWLLNSICSLSVLVVVCIITFIQRHHLFIWTVFAPKVLIESSNSLILFIQFLSYFIFNLYK